MSMARLPDEKLFELYRSYIGEPDSERDVYVGFGLFLGGIVLAVIALVLFLWSNTLDTGSDAYYAWVEPAYALGLLSLPTVMLGIVVLLPAERRVLGVSVGGAAITAIATVAFVIAYPSDWHHYGDDHTVVITVTYAVGLAGITVSTGAALIAHYLEMARTVEEIREETDEDEKESYTDAEIRGDIDEAMEGVELSWGGVEKSDNTTLTFTDHEFESADVGTMGVKRTRSKGVQDQVAGLKGLKGGETKTAKSTRTVDDQTQKLKALREQQQAEELATADDASPIESVRSRIGAAVTGFRSRLGSVRDRVKRN